MSFKKVEEVKSDKGFKILDLIVYGAIAVLVAVVFISVFFTRNKDPLDGIHVYIRDDVIYEYVFGKGGNAFIEGVEERESDGKVTVKISLDDWYNIFEIDTEAKSIKMIDSDCDVHGVGDCLYMPAITDNSGFIYCQPHSLHILPANYEEDDQNILM